MCMPVPPQSEQSAAGSAMSAPLSMPASIALARRRFPLPRVAVAHRHSRGKVEMYVILWEFVVPPEKVDAFVAAYKDRRRLGKALRTGRRLRRHRTALFGGWSARYITIDRWQHAEDFTRFQKQFGTQYGALDTATRRLDRKRAQTGNVCQRGMSNTTGLESWKCWMKLSS